MTALLRDAARLLRAGRPADAVAPLAEAARLRPADAVILHDLGLACLESGRLPQAAASLRQATALDPRYTDAYFRLGLTLERLGDGMGAVAAFDQATLLLPGHAEAWFRAGALVFSLGHREAAIGCFRRAAATGPKTRFGRLGAARALLAEHRDAEAEQVLRRALALDASHAMAHDLLSNLLADAGRFTDARACFERAIAISPLMAGSYYDLVRCGRITPEDGDLPARIEAALAAPGLDASNRLRLYLARGKVADDLGDHQQAMAAYDAADLVRRGTTGFDAPAFEAQVDRLIALFPAERLARAAPGHPDAAPILIIGLPRSGTTLVEQIVSSHPDVAAGGELDFWNEQGAAWQAAGEAGFAPAFLDQAASDYLGILRAIGPARVTDKMPFNFLWAGLIHLCLPGATFLHCRRSAIDTALSIHQTLFSPRLAFPTGGPELVGYIRAATRLTDHWRRVLPAGRFIDIAYERLTQTPEPAIADMLAGCGLPWNEACLRPEDNSGTIRTASRWQARQPITGAIARWRRYEPWLGPLRALLDPR